MNNIKCNSDKGVKEIQIRDITPDYAKELLSCNIDNRNIMKSRVSTYASDMRKGNWRQNGVPFYIGDDGKLKDGQHRLLACIEANVILKNQVVIMLSSDEASCYDIGKTRTTKDIMEFEGVTDIAIKNNSIISGITYCLKFRDKTSAPSKIDIINTAIENKDACYFAYRNLVTKAKHMNGIKRASVIAAIICAYLNNYPLDILKSFCDCLCTGIPKEQKEIGIIKLRDYVISNRMGGTATQDEIFFRTQNHLNAYLKNKSLSFSRGSSTLYYEFPNKNI